MMFLEEVGLASDIFCRLIFSNERTWGFPVWHQKLPDIVEIKWITVEMTRLCCVRSECHAYGQRQRHLACTVYPKKYAHGFCFAVLCWGFTLTDFPISTRLTSLALWQSNDCPSASKATLMNIDKYFMWIHYEQLHNHNKPKHNKTVC